MSLITLKGGGRGSDQSTSRDRTHVNKFWSRGQTTPGLTGIETRSPLSRVHESGQSVRPVHPEKKNWETTQVQELERDS